MTVSYSNQVFTCQGWGIFLKLLRRWVGSIYKLVWRELVVYVILFTALSLTYRLALNEHAKKVFEEISVYCHKNGGEIPITFVLGFYVSLIVNRWWQQFECLPWPDSQALWVSASITGPDERCRLMRRTIVRYLNLALVLTMRLICLPVKKRFPTLDHLVEAGILEEQEKEIMIKVEDQSHQPIYWMPLKWACSVAKRARKENRIKSDYLFTELISQIDRFRGKAGTLLNYDWVPVPLVYTQVVTLAVYSYLLSTLMGSQFLDKNSGRSAPEVDLYIPVFTFLQFFFYMGWLKVAEALINPFGEDDDDFEMNWIIDRNLQISYLIVDELHEEHPNLVRDQFWDELYPEMPYTAASEDTKIDPIIGSAAQVEIPLEDSAFIHDDLRMVIVGDDGVEISDTKFKQMGDRQRSPSKTSTLGSRITLDETGFARSIRKLTPSAQSMVTKLNTFFKGRSTSSVQTPRTTFGSTLSIMSKSSRQVRTRRLSKTRRSNSKLSCVSTIDRMGTTDRSEVSKDSCDDKWTPLVKYDSVPSLESDSSHQILSGRNGGHLSVSPRQSGGCRHFGDVADFTDVVNRSNKLSVASSPEYYNSHTSKQKYDILHSFTLATLNAMRQEAENNEESDPFELFRVLDDAHHQHRKRLLTAIRKISDQGNCSVVLSTEQCLNSDEDSIEDNENVDELQSKNIENRNSDESPQQEIVQTDDTAEADEESQQSAFPLSTIEEQPELGYNSDSSETDALIPRPKSSGDLESGNVATGGFLPTVLEDPNEKDPHQTNG